MQEVFDFDWQVATGGYRWVRAEAAPIEMERMSVRKDTGEPEGKGQFLTAITPPFTARHYAPLREYPALFRTFIEVPPTQDGMLVFANQYGLLGEGITTPILLPNQQGARGELLRDWQEALAALKQVVGLWDLIQEAKIERLVAHIVWKEKSVTYDSHPELPSHEAPLRDVHVQNCIAAEDHDPDLFARFQRGDVGQPALYYVQRVVNQHLASEISPQLLWNLERTQLGLYMVPSGLIWALWLQFAQAITGHKQYHRCGDCGTWFEVSLAASRPTRVYCSDACRFKAYRKRQEDAYQLHQQGISLKEIAKRLGTDTATAKGWIKRKED